MKKLYLTSLLIVISIWNSQSYAASKDSSNKINSIIPISKDYSFNQRWVNPKIAEPGFWYCVSASYSKLYDPDRYGWQSHAKAVKGIAQGILKKSATIGNNPAENYKFKLFQAGKIPLRLHGHSPTGWDAKKKVMTYNYLPIPAERKALEAMVNFIGWSSFGEWGNALHYWIGRKRTPPSYAKPAKAALCPKPPRNQKQFADIAAKFWKAYNKPLDYQVEAHDGSFYWALQWPSILGARAVINETRYVGRNNVGFQDFTRAAGRMGNIPWGFAPGATFDVRWGQGPQRSNIGPRATEQLSRGYALYPHNLMRRLMYFWCMGGASIIGDEATYRSIDDPEQDGTYRFTPYGYIIDEVVDFSRHYTDRGTTYTPLGILLSWDNAFVSPKYKARGGAYNLFKYNIGEQMTMELFDRVLNPIPAGSGWNSPMVHFGATPHGEIFDPLRIDTPKGPLPMELLQNYKVLMAVGQQNISPALTKRLKDYVKQGGTLILNVKQLEQGLLKSDFTGVGLVKNSRQANQIICTIDNKKLSSAQFSYTPLKVKRHSLVLYKAANGDPLVTRHRYGKGWVIIMAPHWLLDDKAKHILPIADDMIGRLAKAIMPVKIRGEKVAERLLYQINKKGQGWVISLFNNAGVKYTNKTPVTIWPSYKVEAEIVVPTATKDAVEWLSRNRLKVNNGLVKVTVSPGEVKIIEIQPKKIAPIKVSEQVNLAIGSKVTASSFCAGKQRNRCDSNIYTNTICKDNSPEKAVNGNRDIYDAWWSKTHADLKSKELPWLEVDLGAVKKIRSINPIYMWSEDSNALTRIYQYYIEISKDGKKWTTVIDERKNSSPANRRGTHYYFVENPLEARYVRITTTLASAHGGAQIVEFEIYGFKKLIKTYPWGK